MVLWQHVLLCKLYGAENARDCGCVSCVMLRDTLFLSIHVYAATCRYIDVHLPDIGSTAVG
jgi:hypothetical protein